MSKDIIQTIDSNNLKALSVASLTLSAAENGLAVDFISSLEVITDYLKCNNSIFDQNM